MTKADISRAITVPGIPKTAVEEIVDGVFNGIKSSLKSGVNVQIHGFGTFKVKSRAERKARNMKTGEEVMVPERRVVIFSCGETLKKEVNG